MRAEEEWADLKNRIKLYVIWAVGLVADALLLLAWAVIQWAANWAINQFPLEGTDRLAFGVAQVLFAITTLAPVVIFFISDIVKVAFRTFVRAAREATEDAKRKGRRGIPRT